MALGADISWLPHMEATGYKFYNDNGEEEDCFKIRKDHGINSIRLRIFMNPDYPPIPAFRDVVQPDLKFIPTKGGTGLINRSKPQLLCAGIIRLLSLFIFVMESEISLKSHLIFWRFPTV
jgi:hypothetical protein